MAMDGEIQLNIGASWDDTTRRSATKNAKDRKVSYESKRSEKVKKIRRKAAEERRAVKKLTNSQQKRHKDRKKEDSGYANIVLRGEVLPNVFPNENKLVFPHLALRKSITDDSTRFGKHKRKDNTRRPNDVAKDFSKFHRKSNDSKKQEEIKKSSGDNFASFVSQSTISNNTAEDREPTKSSRAGKFFRKSNKIHDASKKEFRFGFDELAEKNDHVRFVDFPDDDVPVDKPMMKSHGDDYSVNRTKRKKPKEFEHSVVNFPDDDDKVAVDEPKIKSHGDDDSVNRTKHKKPKKLEEIPQDIASPRKSGKRRRDHNNTDSEHDASDVGEANDGDEGRPKAKRANKEGKVEDESVQWKGKQSSLFFNNPEIPMVARRAVRPVYEPVFANEKFSELPIHKFSVSNLSSLGLTQLTTVQRKAVPVLLEGRDALVRSQTGSGKTLAYALPLVELLQRQRPALTRVDGVRALVVLPTRELALQTYEWFVKLVKPFMRLVPGCLVGGEKRKSEKARLRKGITILVGTPGRILDHIRATRCLRLNKVQYLVLDEADRLLDMGYERDVASIISELDSQTQPLLSQDVLAWNRKTFNEENDTPQEDRPRKKKDQVAGYASQDSGAGEEESSDGTDNERGSSRGKKEVKRKELSKEDVQRIIIDAVRRRKEEDETSDYDPEERADEVLDAKELESEDSEAEEEEEEVEEEYEGAGGREEDGRHAGRSGGKQRYEQPHGGSEEQEARRPKAPGRWQTVLLSATLSPAVERLAGLALRSPTFVDAADADADTQDVVIPDSLAQRYIVVPAKLRLVTLSAFIVWKCKFTEGRKMLLFCATQDMVDYLTELLTVGLSRKDTDEESDSDEDTEDPEESFKIGVDFFRLHGNMDQKERTHVFQTFRAAECGVLLCTDVAARGLDLPRVDWIVQFTAPGSVPDYVHRVGRTARVGAAGSALLFLLPAEADFVQLLQDRRISLQEETVETCLKKLALANGSSQFRKQPPTVESAATALQLRYENAVLARRSLHNSAIKAYVSFVRFYASYPKEVREVFRFKSLHLGHHAKSFALRDPPKTIAGIGRSRFYKDQEQQSGKRPKQHDGALQRGPKVPEAFAHSRKRTREHLLSEFASGL